MNFDRIREKLNILADAAKYDISCASSGSDRTIKTKVLEMPPKWVSATVIPRMDDVYPY